MDNEKSVDEAVQAIVMLGSTSAAEEYLCSKAGFSIEKARDLIEEAHAILTTSAPPELRGSLSAVVSFHRWNKLFKMAVIGSDARSAAEAQKQLDKLIKGVH